MFIQISFCWELCKQNSLPICCFFPGYVLLKMASRIWKRHMKGSSLNTSETQKLFVYDLDRHWFYLESQCWFFVNLLKFSAKCFTEFSVKVEVKYCIAFSYLLFDITYNFVSVIIVHNNNKWVIIIPETFKTQLVGVINTPRTPIVQYLQWITCDSELKTQIKHLPCIKKLITLLNMSLHVASV